jgi:hypothetical protein
MPHRPTVASVLKTIRKLTASERAELFVELMPDIEAVCEDSEAVRAACPDLLSFAEGDRLVRIKTANDVFHLIFTLSGTIQSAVWDMFLRMFEKKLGPAARDVLKNSSLLALEVEKLSKTAIAAGLRKRGPRRPDVVADVIRRRESTPPQSFGAIGRRYRKSSDWAEQTYKRWSGDRRKDLGDLV